MEKNYIRDFDYSDKKLDNDEIDLIEILKTIWTKRKFLLKFIVVSFIIGLIIALTSNTEFEARCKLLPDVEESPVSRLGGLGGLAGLAGIDLTVGTQGNLSPDLYPEIAKSLNFQLELINHPIRFEKLDTTISSYQYFKEYKSPSLISIISSYTIGLPGKIKDFFSAPIVNEDSIPKSGDIIQLTLLEKDIIEGFKNRIEIEVDNKTNVITISAEMPDKIAAAELVKLTLDHLQNSIIEYKINKSKQNLEFIKERHKEAKKRFEEAQENLARFTDQNRNILSSMVMAEEQRLRNEYNLAFDVFKGLSNQLEQAEIKVKENTPIFTVIEPIQVPLDKSKPKRKLIIAIAIALGVFLGLTVLFTKIFIIPKFKK